MPSRELTSPSPDGHTKATGVMCAGGRARLRNCGRRESMGRCEEVCGGARRCAGVCGHRDLRPGEVEEPRDAIRSGQKPSAAFLSHPNPRPLKATPSCSIPPEGIRSHPKPSEALGSSRCGLWRTHLPEGLGNSWEMKGDRGRSRELAEAPTCPKALRHVAWPTKPCTKTSAVSDTLRSQPTTPSVLPCDAATRCGFDMLERFEKLAESRRCMSTGPLVLSVSATCSGGEAEGKGEGEGEGIGKSEG